MKKRPGDSTTQREIEIAVFDLIKERGIPNLKVDVDFSGLSDETINFDKTKFKADFYITDKLIGEIFTCQYKLQAAQKKKVQGDILKMLTIEELWKSERPKAMVTKVFIMVLNSTEPALSLVSNEIQGTFIKAKDDKFYINNLGEDSWIWSAINVFDIHVYYYILDETNSNELTKLRRIQKKATRKD